PGVAFAGGGAIVVVAAAGGATVPDVSDAGAAVAGSALVCTVPLPTGVTVAPLFCAKLLAPAASRPAARRAAMTGEKRARRV
ncbi:hypothetical protein, partial [Burkholderia ubonensis]|uniref:hypothetical protein n=1 Tax=Burkholderia ubonensis TaxID=101571 RepID=UPI003F752FD9